ncbi:COG4223 family protein [Thalassospira mesophila]|uniref:COG4223 family protein n=1 Tax=Thalassospira mesophila TaxID=1293891 RepID=UPI000A1D8018|nr:mitofilin family membrane protein [Thalassospira mesophila]
MKKPETPKTDTSATPAKGQDTISIDSKGNANTGAAPAQSTPSSKDSAASASASPSPSAASTAKPGDAPGSTKATATTPPGANKPANASVPPGGTSKPASSATKPASPSSGATGSGPFGASGSGGKNTSGNNNGPSRPASGTPSDKPAKPGKPAIMVVIWAVIIVAIVLALTWASRSLWWQQAQPALSDLLPQTAIEALAPDTANTGTITQNTAPAATPRQDTDEGSTPDDAAQGGTQTNTATNTTTPPATSSDGDANSTSQASDNASDGDGMGNMGMDTQQAAPSADTDISKTYDTPDTSDTSDTPGSHEGQASNVVVASDLTARLSHLEGTIGALRERLDKERGGELNDSVARRLGELETRTAPIDDVARVQSELSGVAKEMRDLTARMATVEDELKATEGLRIAGRGQAIGIAVAILRDAAQRGGPFEVALNQLTRSGSDDPVVQKQIASLEPLASTGAPRIEQLRQTFSGAAEDAIKSASDDNSGGIWDSTVANLKKLFPIRRVDVVGQETLDGRLVTAEQALAQDNLADAITTLEGIEGENAKTALKPWLDQAHARQTINQAIDVLSSHAIGLLTGTEDKTGNATTGSEDAQ